MVGFLYLFFKHTESPLAGSPSTSQTLPLSSSHIRRQGHSSRQELLPPCLPSWQPSVLSSAPGARKSLTGERGLSTRPPSLLLWENTPEKAESCAVKQTLPPWEGREGARMTHAKATDSPFPYAFGISHCPTHLFLHTHALCFVPGPYQSPGPPQLLSPKAP